MEQARDEALNKMTSMEARLSELETQHDGGLLEKRIRRLTNMEQARDEALNKITNMEERLSELETQHDAGRLEHRIRSLTIMEQACEEALNKSTSMEERLSELETQHNSGRLEQRIFELLAHREALQRQVRSLGYTPVHTRNVMAVNNIVSQLPPLPRVCIVGGTKFKDHATKSLVELVSGRIAKRFANRIVVLTGGMSGVQQTFADGLSKFPGLVHLLPAGTESGFGVGRDVVAGESLDERVAIFGQVGQVYITFEGGPKAAEEAKVAFERGAIVLPFKSTGGASAGMFGFPRGALAKPGYVTPEQWASFHDKASPDLAAGALVDIISHLLASGRLTGEPEERDGIAWTRGFYDRRVLDEILPVSAHGRLIKPMGRTAGKRDSDYGAREEDIRNGAQTSVWRHRHAEEDRTVSDGESQAAPLASPRRASADGVAGQATTVSSRQIVDPGHGAPFELTPVTRSSASNPPSEQTERTTTPKMFCDLRRTLDQLAVDLERHGAFAKGTPPFSARAARALEATPMRLDLSSPWPSPASMKRLRGGTRVFICCQQTHNAAEACVPWAGVVDSVKASLPPFNKRDCIAPPETAVAFDMPCYGARLPRAVMALFEAPAIRALAAKMDIRIPPYVLDRLAKDKMTTVLDLVAAARQHPDCEIPANGQAVAKVEDFVRALDGLGDRDIQSMNEWQEFVNAYALHGWQDKLHVDDLLAGTFGFDEGLARELRPRHRKALQWLSKALTAYGPKGCLTDVVNLVCAMMCVGHGGEVKEATIIETINAFGEKLTRDDLTGLWVPTHLAHDMASDDLLCWLLLEHLHSWLGTRLRTLVQLPPAGDPGIDHLATRITRIPACDCKVFRDPDSSNSKEVKAACGID